MNDNWSNVIAVLSGETLHPIGRCVSYGAALEEAKIRELCKALSGSRFRGGIRLQGCGIDDNNASLIATALRDQNYLSSIDMPDNAIGFKGCAALLAMLESNGAITGLGLDGNPCKTDPTAANLLTQIDWHIVRNRSTPPDNSSAEASPLSTARMQRSRARIEEVSPETPSGLYPSPTQDRGFAARGLSFANGPTDAGDAMSEPSCGEDRRWFNDLLFRIGHLEDRAEDYQMWQEGFSRESGIAMAKLNQLETILNKTRDELAELNDWRGQQQMISDNNSAHIQRQNGDFSGLRDKVIRLHTQFELVTKGGPEALEKTLAMIANATSALPLSIERRGSGDGSGDALLQRVSELIKGNEIRVNEALEDWQAAISKFTGMMQDHAGIVHSLESSSSQYENRLKALEKANAITEEDEDTAVQQAIEDLQKMQSEAFGQLSSVKSELQGIRHDLVQNLQTARNTAAQEAEALRRHVDKRLDVMAASQQKHEQESAAKHSAHARQVSDTRKALEMQLGDLKELIAAGSRSQADLRERLNFHENLIMDEQHGSRNAAVAVSTSQRLDGLSGRVQHMEDSLKKSFLDEVGKIWRNQKPALSEQDIKEYVNSGQKQAVAEMHARFAVLRKEVTEISGAADNKLEQLQRSQIYIEQKLEQQIAAEKTNLEQTVKLQNAKVDEAVTKGREEMEALSKDQGASLKQINQLKAQFAGDYEQFGKKAALMQEQLVVMGKSLDAQHSNLSKVKSLQTAVQQCTQQTKRLEERLTEMRTSSALHSDESSARMTTLQEEVQSLRGDLDKGQADQGQLIQNLAIGSEKLGALLKTCNAQVQRLVQSGGVREAWIREAQLEQKLAEQTKETRKTIEKLENAQQSQKDSHDRQMSHLAQKIQELIESQKTELADRDQNMHIFINAMRPPVSHRIDFTSADEPRVSKNQPAQNPARPLTATHALTEQQNIMRNADMLIDEKRANAEGRENQQQASSFIFRFP